MNCTVESVIFPTRTAVIRSESGKKGLLMFGPSDRPHVDDQVTVIDKTDKNGEHGTEFMVLDWARKKSKPAFIPQSVVGQAMMAATHQ